MTVPYAPAPRKPNSTVRDLLICLAVIGAFAAISLGYTVYASGLLGNDAIGPFAQEEWDPVLEPYVEFVESERGLRFGRPVDVRFANIAEEVAAGFEENRAALEAAQASLDELPVADPYGDAFTLLGLVDFEADLDSQESTEESIIANAGAFYDPFEDEIVLPEGESLLSLELTIVHELTHALQDQNGMLDYYPDTADSSQARLALIEGDAERIAEAWFVQMTVAERQAYLDAIDFDPNQPFEDPGNSYLDSTFFVSYGLGVPLVMSIIETDGEEELNRLLRSPEVGSTERFIDLLGDSDSQQVNALVEFDPPKGRDEADGDLGALAWFATLAPIVGTDGAFDALIGYDDDAFAIYENADGSVCGRFEVFFDDADEAAEFVAIAGEAGIVGAADAQRRSVTSDICEQIGDPADQRIAVVFPLIVANELVLHHLLNGEDEQTARCAALAQVKTLPIDRSLDDFEGYDALFVASTSFVDAC